MKKIIEKLARECAADVIKAAGTRPTDTDGESLLPTEPLPGDWDYLEDELGREPTEDEQSAFSDTYEEVTVRAEARVELLQALRQCDHTPDPETVRNIRAFLGVTQTDFADKMGVNDGRHVRKWEAGDSAVSETAGLLMASLLREAK